MSPQIIAFIRVAAFRTTAVGAPVSALVLNDNTFTIAIRPDGVWTEPPGRQGFRQRLRVDLKQQWELRGRGLEGLVHAFILAALSPRRREKECTPVRRASFSPTVIHGPRAAVSLQPNNSDAPLSTD